MHAMKLSYKKAGKEEAALIAALAERIWKKHYSTIITRAQIEYMFEKMYSAGSLIRQMNEGHEFTLVYLDERPVGYISLSTKDHKNYFLHKFYVEADEQAKGIGTQLLGYIIASLKNPQSIELTVNRQNYKAVNFYFKNGFVIKEVADFDIGNGYFMNDFVMAKKIN
ncbi:MAG: family N-acetyltransferase [Bacteroidetes bacterium]|nr:family N-acetyltransferase [Bacteroidota bacterium]